MKIKSIVVVFLLSMVFASCQFEESDIQYNMGNDFISDPTNVIMVDTLSLYTYTTTVDSFTTSRCSRFLTGSSTNKYGSETYCETYLCFEINDASSFHSTAEYDSIALVMKLDGYNYGDTSQVGEFGVYKLEEQIVVNDNSGYLYNTSHFSSEATPIGTFTINYNAKDSLVVVRLDDVLGKDFFTLTKDASTLMTEKDLFDEYFKGVVIKPIASSFVAGIFGVVDSVAAPRIRVYFHDITVNDNLYFDFPLEKYESSSTNINYRSFNHIENRYNGTVLEGLQPNEEKLSSLKTDNVTFCQAGGMLQTRIEIPAIDNLYPLGIGAIVKAELFIEPEKGTYNEAADLPAKLQMNIVDEKNRIYNPLYSTGTTDNAYGYLNFNREFKSKTHYTFDITNFVKTEYEDKGDPVYALMMYIPYDSGYPNLDQLIIGNGKNIENKMKLKVYLTNY